MKRRTFLKTSAASAIALPNLGYSQSGSKAGFDSLVHGPEWESLNPGYWKIKDGALRRRLGDSTAVLIELGHGAAKLSTGVNDGVVPQATHREPAPDANRGAPIGLLDADLPRSYDSSRRFEQTEAPECPPPLRNKKTSMIPSLYGGMPSSRPPTQSAG